MLMMMMLTTVMPVTMAKATVLGAALRS